MIRSIAFAAVLILVGLPGGASRAQGLPQIWLAPRDDLPRPTARFAPPVGFADLFRPGAPWQRALRHVQVFEITEFYLFHAPEERLLALFAFLRAHHVALAVALGPLHGYGRCGFHVEGYSAPGSGTAIARRVAKLGGTIDYANMDEPLFYGHYFAGPNACRASVPAIVRTAAESARQISAVFPGARIGDTEPVARIEPAVLNQWLDGFRAAYGRPLAFYHLDVQWDTDWVSRTLWQARMVQRAGVPLGVIYNGDPRTRSSLAWVESAAAHFRIVERLLGGEPQQAIFTSWTLFPRRILPESDPATLTGLILAYVTAHGLN